MTGSASRSCHSGSPASAHTRSATSAQKATCAWRHCAASAKSSPSSERRRSRPGATARSSPRSAPRLRATARRGRSASAARQPAAAARPTGLASVGVVPKAQGVGHAFSLTTGQHRHLLALSCPHTDPAAVRITRPFTAGCRRADEGSPGARDACHEAHVAVLAILIAWPGSDYRALDCAAAHARLGCRT